MKASIPSLKGISTYLKKHTSQMHWSINIDRPATTFVWVIAATRTSTWQADGIQVEMVDDPRQAKTILPIALALLRLRSR